MMLNPMFLGSRNQTFASLNGPDSLSFGGHPSWCCGCSRGADGILLHWTRGITVLHYCRVWVRHGRHPDSALTQPPRTLQRSSVAAYVKASLPTLNPKPFCRDASCIRQTAA